MDIGKAGDVYKDIKNRATEALRTVAPYAARSSGVYDVRKNKVIIAGFEIDGVVDAQVSAEVLTRHESGIDHRYVAIYKSIEQKTLTLELLPTANCLDFLYRLGEYQQRYSGWFNISIHENGKLVDVYRAWINQLPEVSLKAETENKKVIFGIKTMLDSVARVDTPTKFETETYKNSGRDRIVDIDGNVIDGIDENQVIVKESDGTILTSGIHDEYIEYNK